MSDEISLSFFLLFYDFTYTVCYIFTTPRLKRSLGQSICVPVTRVHVYKCLHNMAAGYLRPQGQYWIEYLYLLLAAPPYMAAANFVVIGP